MNEITKEEFLKAIKPVTYKEWITTIEENFPEIKLAVDACMSVVSLHWFKDVNLPFALTLVGCAACGKTTTLNCFDEINLSEMFYRTDSFTGAAFVTQSSDTKDEKELKGRDLIRKIKDKTMIVHELAPFFSQKDDDLRKVIGNLTRVLDGMGFSTDTGTHGRRGIREDVKFMFLGATTPLAYRVWDMMGLMGSKMYFFQMPTPKEMTIEEIRKAIKEGSEYKRKMKACQEITTKFISSIAPKEPITWDESIQPDEVIDRIGQIGGLLARLRTTVNVSIPTEYQNERITDEDKKFFTRPMPEVPLRAQRMLYTLAKGHAFIQGRNIVLNDDLPILIEVALSSAPQDRVDAFRALLKHGGTITTKELEKALNCSKHTAIRAMQTLAILGLANINMSQMRGGEGFKITLPELFNWCLKEQFMLDWGAKARVFEQPKQGQHNKKLGIDEIFEKEILDK